ncbi:MAG: ATP-binding protein [Gordonia sp. (in: high G+C Gram-positive bacteria)]|nr:MAG: ATP-binding protein [Gordonia sp. (in: high G+C Gram-positive bacteria)]
MTSTGSETVGIRPYARLLTMLGEQLIKNDRIALVELIKNSYDADAARVWVDFAGVKQTSVNSRESRLTLVDDGIGMSETTIKEHWLNPATPGKEEQKRQNPKTKLGRVVQGEKGIGRFAIFKLGSTATIITRSRDSDEEFVLEYDLSFLDRKLGDDTLALQVLEDGSEESTPKFIDEIQVRLTRRVPVVFDGANADGLSSKHGTRIEIAKLRSSWTENSIRRAYSEVARLQPLVPVDDVSTKQQDVESGSEPDFIIMFSQDGVQLPFRTELDQQLQRLFDERSVLRVSGNYSDSTREFSLDINGHESAVSLADPDIAGLSIYKRYFGDAKNPRSPENLECGSFDFRFFVFDISAGAPVEHKLDRDERERVKEHRIYLYRDGVRVLPYGDAEDDWLQLDVIRGTQKSSRVLSNDQTVGFVYITQEGNPALKDKTNREGLLEAGHAFDDFVTLLQLVISYIRAGEFARYLANEERKKEAKEQARRPVETGFERILSSPELAESLRKEVRQLERAYNAERRMHETRSNRTEDLAGVGLSVEAASHDIVATANHALRHARSIEDHVAALLPGDGQLLGDISSLIESLSFVTSRLQDIQGLFVSTRQRRRSLPVHEYVERVARIYSSLLAQSGTKLNVTTDDRTLMVKSTDAALLQVLINLFDNALYWLTTANTADPKIEVRIDADSETLWFADNGPGVRDSDAPYIFEPFYSGKGEEGKGLGLYIARQVGARSGFSIDLVSNESRKLLPGANFLISFGEASGDE